MAVQGIDVSTYQRNVDYKKLKQAGISFVIIRAGYGRYFYQKDLMFEEHYKNAKAAGLDVGAYWYSYASSAEDAKTEAKTCLEVIKGKKFEYPIYFDLEEKFQFNNGQAFCDSLVKAFCSTMESAGYFAGLYISRFPLQNYISKSVSQKYTLWVAEYGSKLNYDGDYGMWQNSSTYHALGYNGNLDHDYCYKDYPKIIMSGGYNGYKKTSQAIPKKKDVTTLAQEVLNGDWGNGTDRKQRLTAAGYDYNAVQAKVNQLLNTKSIDTIAREVIRGDWGNGNDRKRRLTEAGYDYNKVQAKVNQLLR